jgi:hypothetical protein
MKASLDVRLTLYSKGGQFPHSLLISHTLLHQTKDLRFRYRHISMKQLQHVFPGVMQTPRRKVSHAGKTLYRCHHRSCKTTCTSRRDLRRHCGIHSQHKPYGCSACTTCFTRPSDFNKHSKLPHDGFLGEITIVPYPRKNCTDCDAIRGIRPYPSHEKSNRPKASSKPTIGQYIPCLLFS